MAAYYNEVDKHAAAWLRELIKAGLIAQGDVDERSIVDVEATDLAGYEQCHFFAGIGGWSYALRLAGVPDDAPIWTGSCPCQPFSVAGKGLGTADERHLWPEFYRLISERRPSVCFGEQVAAKAGREWLAGVRVDLEAVGYAVGAADLCAAGVGAPHIRQRLYWVADAAGSRHAGARQGASAHGDGASALPQRGNALAQSSGRSSTDGLADLHSNRRNQGRGSVAATGSDGAVGDGSAVRLGDTNNTRPQGRDGVRERAGERSPWSSSVVINCRDGKARRIPTEPAFFPLAYGLPGRVVQLHGLGNAIVPEQAATFIEAWLESTRL
jgi:DNA (cytosine-5)-methyltransferase 1